MKTRTSELVGLFALALGACGTGTSSSPVSPFTVGGTVTGLVGTLVLQNNGADDLTLAASGVFTLATPTVAYSVTVFAQPLGQTCTVANGAGTATAAVTSVAVTCATNTYAIGGVLSGLAGTLVLQNNGADDLRIAANGVFAFAAPAAAYHVTILSHPPEQTCTVTDGVGVATAAVTSIGVSCVTNAFAIGGSLSGLIGTLVLQNEGADNLTLTGNGPFAFATTTASYTVTVLTEPLGQTCTVTNATGIAVAAVSTVAVNCVTKTYSIGGSITGLVGTVVLQNNGLETLGRSADGSFAFAASPASFRVTIMTQPVGQTCSLLNGVGTTTSAVTTIAVNCVNNPPNTFSIGGNITGLTGTAVLRNNGSDDLSVSGNGPFNFATPTADYKVTLFSKSAELECQLTNASGTATAVVTTVAIDCTPVRFFRATDGSNGYELWVTDGTALGTFMLKDINIPGGMGASNSQPTFFTLFGNTVYFSASDGVVGTAMWKTDGTAAGTVQVIDIDPGAPGFGPSSYTEFNGALYFNAYDGINGQELWRSDGSAAGTAMLKDINAGAASSSPLWFAVLGGALYFQADDGVHGKELWKTDGTGPGTVMVKDINVSSAGASSLPNSMTAYNGELYFRADDGINGTEL